MQQAGLITKSKQIGHFRSYTYILLLNEFMALSNEIYFKILSLFIEIILKIIIFIQNLIKLISFE